MTWRPRASRPRSKIDARALGIRFDAFMFSCSHKSLVKQALTGTGTAYKKMGEELQSKHPRHDGGAGSRRLARASTTPRRGPSARPRKRFRMPGRPCSAAARRCEICTTSRSSPTASADHATAASSSSARSMRLQGRPSEADFCGLHEKRGRAGLLQKHKRIAINCDQEMMRSRPRGGAVGHAWIRVEGHAETSSSSRSLDATPHDVRTTSSASPWWSETGRFRAPSANAA